MNGRVRQGSIENRTEAAKPRKKRGKKRWKTEKGLKIRLPDVEERKTFYGKDGSNENGNSKVRKILRTQNLKFILS